MTAARSGKEPGTVVRPEREPDRAHVRALNLAAFPTAAEADLVDALRERASLLVSLVAESAGHVIGHIMFSPVSIASAPACRVMGLAPMAVAAGARRRGVGAAMIEADLERCRRIGTDAVVVLGHPSYYPRFGFSPGTGWGIGCEYDVPADVFMVRELRSGALRGVSGIARYHDAFAGL